MDSGVMPALPSSAENAIEKQPACAAPISSSGLVPTPSSNRVLNEYCVFDSTPLSVEIVPLPVLRSPFHIAEAERFIMSSAGPAWAPGAVPPDSRRRQGRPLPRADAR